MADESKWWPQIVGHVLRHGLGPSRSVNPIEIGALRVCTGGDTHNSIRAYDGVKNRSHVIYMGDDLEECRDRIAEYFRTREMFPVDQNQERPSA